ncbi:MAG: 3-oxoacyl-ACP synthase [Halanaerobiales bacterium]|nr:3-oxoacyl-ACP synthase [Halanaerobiales bacterium]
MRTNCGIAGIGVYLPENYLTAEELSKKCGIPVNIIHEKMGLKSVVVPGENDHTCEMALKAAKNCLQNSEVKPEDIDVIIYNGEDYKEYIVWTAAIKIQKELGALNAWAFDLSCRCSATPVALKVAKDLIKADENINTVLIAGGTGNVSIVDYKDPSCSFMYTAGAGGCAVLIQRDYPHNQLLESAIHTESMFADSIYALYGRRENPASQEMVPPEEWKLRVNDIDFFKENLNRLTLPTFLKVAKESVEKSGCTVKDLNYAAVTHIKPSSHAKLLQRLGLGLEQTTYLEDYGHMGCVDPILSIKLGIENNKIKSGDHIILLSAGIGFTWAASTIKWG